MMKHILQGENYIEAAVIDNLIKESTFVSLFFKSGLNIKGQIKRVDEHGFLLLSSKRGEQYVFKNSIATICLLPRYREKLEDTSEDIKDEIN